MAPLILSLCLGTLGIIGTIIFVVSAGIVLWRYRGTRPWSFRWQSRNWRLTQISAVATFFFLAMTASFGVIGEPWTWLCLLIACMTGTWWLRFVVSR